MPCQLTDAQRAYQKIVIFESLLQFLQEKEKGKIKNALQSLIH
jgi:hypothetical protein